jgi:nicotinamidase-related amidase
MDAKRTALLQIEFQHDFTSPGGTLHDAVKGV